MRIDQYKQLSNIERQRMKNRTQTGRFTLRHKFTLQWLLITFNSIIIFSVGNSKASSCRLLTQCLSSLADCCSAVVGSNSRLLTSRSSCLAAVAVGKDKTAPFSGLPGPGYNKRHTYTRHTLQHHTTQQWGSSPHVVDAGWFLFVGDGGMWISSSRSVGVTVLGPNARRETKKKFPFSASLLNIKLRICYPHIELTKYVPVKQIKFK